METGWAMMKRLGVEWRTAPSNGVKWMQTCSWMLCCLLGQAQLPTEDRLPRGTKGLKLSQHHVPPGFCFSLHKGGDCTRSGCTWNHSCPQCNRGNSLKNCRNRDGPQPRESTQSENLPHNKRQGNEGRKWPVDRKPGEPTAHVPAIVLVPRLPTPVDFKAIKPYSQGYPPWRGEFSGGGLHFGIPPGGTSYSARYKYCSAESSWHRWAKWGDHSQHCWCLFLKTGDTHAFFQSSGSTPSHNECWKISVRIRASSGAASFRIRQGMLWGPVALFALILLRSFWTPLLFTWILPIWGKLGPYGVGISEDFLVKMDLNWLFRISALDRPSANNFPWDFSGATPMFSLHLEWMNFQKGFGVCFSEGWYSMMLFT